MIGIALEVGLNLSTVGPFWGVLRVVKVSVTIQVFGRLRLDVGITLAGIPNTSQLARSFVTDNFVSSLCKRLGSSQAGNTTTNDGDAFAWNDLEELVVSIIKRRLGIVQIGDGGVVRYCP